MTLREEGATDMHSLIIAQNRPKGRKGLKLQKLPNPTSMPSGSVAGVAFSPDSNLLALANTGGTPLLVYTINKSTDKFSRKTVAQPSGSAFGCGFSPNGKHLICTSAKTPFLHIYDYNGTSFSAASIPETPSDACAGLGFTPDGRMLFVSCYGAPYLLQYLYVDGPGVFQCLSPNYAPDANALSNGRNCAVSPNNDFLGYITYSEAPFAEIYRNVDGEWNNLQPVSGFESTLKYRGMVSTFSPDGQHLIFGSQRAPGLFIYKKTGPDSFSLLPNPAIPNNSVQGAAYSPNGKYLVLTHQGAPYISFYERDEDVYTKIDTPAEVDITVTGGKLAFSPDGNYLAVGLSSAPYFAIYKCSY